MALGVLVVGSSLVFWSQAQGEVVSQIPSSLVRSMVVASLLFLFAVWLIIHLGIKSFKSSLLILVGLVVWYGLVIYLASIGFFGKNPLFLPNIIFAFVVIYYFGKYLLSRPSLQQIAAAMPPHYIMNVQVFRVMGVGFLILYSMKILPGAFAIPTGIGDVLVGLTGPIVGYLYQTNKDKWRTLAMHWHRFGIADLVLAVSLAIITYSRPIQLFPTKIPSDPIALYPLAIIPLFAVPLSILLHLFGLSVLKKASGWNF